MYIFHKDETTMMVNKVNSKGALAFADKMLEPEKDFGYWKCHTEDPHEYTWMPIRKTVIFKSAMERNSV
jgi:hypothetical protein